MSQHGIGGTPGIMHKHARRVCNMSMLVLLNSCIAAANGVKGPALGEW